MSTHPLIDRATSQDVNRISSFTKIAAGLGIADLCQWYQEELATAPLRGTKGGKQYFVGHTGIQEREHFVIGPDPSTGEGRKEEHLATALFNDYGPSSQGLVMDAGETVRMLDYQFPLKAKSGDAQVGKVDLLAWTSADRLAVVELKYMPVNGTISRADTPLRAFLEGLAYCALLEADIEWVSQEAIEKFDLPVAKKPPELIVLANNHYWQLFLGYKEASTWTRELMRLAEEVEEQLNIPIKFLSLSIPTEPIRYQEQRPRFVEPPLLARAW